MHKIVILRIVGLLHPDLPIDIVYSILFML